MSTSNKPQKMLVSFYNTISKPAKEKLETLDKEAIRQRISTSINSTKHKTFEYANTVRQHAGRIDASVLKDRASAVSETVYNQSTNARNKIHTVQKSITNRKNSLKANRIKAGSDSRRNDKHETIAEAIEDYNSAHYEFVENGIDLFMYRSMAIDYFSHITDFLDGIVGIYDLVELSDLRERMSKIDAAVIEYKSICDSAALEVASIQIGETDACLKANEDAASVLPVVAVWSAAAFGITATDEALKLLVGRDKTPAVISWFDVGTMKNSSCDMSNGRALLAIAGPIAVVNDIPILLTSIKLLIKKKFGVNVKTPNEYELINNNTVVLQSASIAIAALASQTKELIDQLQSQYRNNLRCYQREITELTMAQLESIVSMTKTAEKLAHMLSSTV